MRISIVGPTYPFRGGISHYTTLLVDYLRAAGHTVHLLSYKRQYPKLLFPGKSDKDPSEVPLKTECEYVLDPLNPVTWLRTCLRIRQLKPELVILQWWVPYWTPCMAFISRWLKQNVTAPLLFVCHNVLPHDGGGVFDKRLTGSVLRYGDRFIVHSTQDLHRLRVMVPGAKVVRVPLPPYSTVYDKIQKVSSHQIKVRENIPSDRRVLLFFGFVRPYKGVEFLIEALSLVVKQYPTTHLLVVGEFWTTPTLYERYAREFGVEEAITFVNKYIPNEEVKAYFDLAEVVVLPYVEATQSGVLQLALSCGKPAIVTRVGGLGEIIHDGVNGLLVPPQDPTALADAIARFFQPEIGQRLTANVQQNAPSNATWDETIQSILQWPT